MKKIIIYIAILMFPVLTKAQWENIPIGVTLYYSGYSYKTKIAGYKKNKEGNPIAVSDTLWKKPMPEFSITLDTVIHLSGLNRKLIVFYGCVNSLFLYYKRYIMLGDLDNLPDNWANEKTSEKATILYKNNTEYYTLTVPKDFVGKYLHSTVTVKQLDDIILAKNVVANDSISSTFNYLFYQNIRLPIIPFINTDQGITRQQQFPDNFHIYAGTTNKKHNHLFKNVDWYEYVMAYGNSEIGINNKYGIVESKYEVKLRQNSNSDYNEGAVIQLKNVK